MAHADAELRRIDGANLADTLSQVLEFGGGREGKPLDVAAANQAVR
jgi:hypothetical protein